VSTWQIIEGIFGIAVFFAIFVVPLWIELNVGSFIVWLVRGIGRIAGWVRGRWSSRADRRSSRIPAAIARVRTRTSMA
jgi:hypothetical protein